LKDNTPSREDVEQAIKTIIHWIGDDPSREGLRETPKRVVDSFAQFFSGYKTDPAEILKKTFQEIEDYQDMVLLKDIRFESHCEHHIIPIIGKAYVAYLPAHRVVGLSKLARLVDIYAKRLQTQENMTVQIARTIDKVLAPRGVAVLIDAAHYCMNTRGVYKPGSSTITIHTTGLFREEKGLKAEFLQLITSK